MNFIISNSSEMPIYEQIKKEIKQAINNHELKENSMLPSIRSLAKDLRISLLTVKKAYDELEQEGYIITRQGKGSHVAPKNIELAKEQAQKDIEKYIEKIVDISNRFEIDENEVIEMFKMFYREEM